MEEQWELNCEKKIKRYNMLENELICKNLKTRVNMDEQEEE
jgi:hypothetical protein